MVINPPTINKMLQKLAELAGQKQTYLMQQAVDLCNNGIIIVDGKHPDYPIIFVNAAFERITGYRSREIIGRNCRFLQRNNREQAGLVQIREAIREGKECVVILQNFRKNGSSFWNEIHLKPIFNDQQELTHFIGIQTDITERKLAEENLQSQAFYDPLTALPNRTLFKKLLEENLQKVSIDPDYLFALLFLDVDEFKLINDSLGHGIGDKLLIALTQRLKQCLRSGDTIARMGGDEFVILLPEISDVYDVVRVTEKIYQQLQSSFKLESYEVFANVSMGIALGSIDCREAHELIRNADIAMYHAKAKGKGRYAVFDRQMHQKAIARLEIETALRRAQLSSEFDIHYQPIVSLITGKAIGLEALLRWQHPERGLIYPNEFISIAEEMGSIVPLGEWVLEQACTQMQLWQQQYPEMKHLSVRVNISGKQLQQLDFVERLEEILARTGLEAQCLKLEITESVLMENTEQVKKILSLIRERDIQLSLDDFGTGYSCLSYLQTFPFNTVKIDRSFIKSITSFNNEAAIVGTIISLAHILKMDTIAEGIETLAQLEQLRCLGCTQAQGYFFSQPLPVRETEAFLRRFAL